MKTIKLLLMVFNFIFIIVGLAVLGAGIGVLVFFEKFVAVTGAGVLITPVVVVVVGALIIIVALLGFFGAIRENGSLVNAYATILGLLLVIQFACAIAAFVLRNKVEKILREDLHEKMQLYYNETSTGLVHSTIDLIQEKFECCGVSSNKDWKTWNQDIPKSCCKDKKECDTSVEKNINTAGCVDTVKGKMKEKILLVAGVALLVCAVELLCIAFGCCLSKALNKAYEPV